jgi:putative ABC transport system ATP-binding protein
MDALIELENVTKQYDNGAAPAVADVSLAVRAGEVVAIMGPSGSGKSTLLNLVAAMDRPTSGAVWVGGERVDLLSETAAARFRRRQVGMVFQFFNLLDDMTVMDNVLLPAQLAGARADRTRAAGARAGGARAAGARAGGARAGGARAGGARAGGARQRAGELLEVLRIAHRRDAYPARLSGGERQRVAIARALINRPAVLLADEPTGAVDSATGEEIGALLAELNSAGQTLILVTHNPDLAARYSRRVIAIDDGRVVSDTQLTPGQTTSPGPGAPEGARR